jgi:hypothetical protein
MKVVFVFWADLATKMLQLKVESNATGWRLQYMYKALSVSVSAVGSCNWKRMLGCVVVRLYTLLHNLKL